MVYKEIKFKDEMLSSLVERSNKMFRDLESRKLISEKEMRYFLFDFKNASNLGKMYFLPKIHKRLDNVPGRPVISNCGTPTERVSEFLDHHLKPVMQSGKSYIKDSGDFLNKIKRLGKIPEGAFLVSVDVVGLYPSIPHLEGLEALRKRLEKRVHAEIPTDKLVDMAKFVLENNIFEFDSRTFQQLAGTAIGTKFAPPYACIFMDELEEEFLEGEMVKPLIWLRYIDDIFFIWTGSEEELFAFLGRLNSFSPGIKFTHEISRESLCFLDLKIAVKEGELLTDMYCKPTDGHQYLHFRSSHPLHTKKSIVYSQSLRLSRICSRKADFDRHKRSMASWFDLRGYPKEMVRQQMDRVDFNAGEKSRESGESGIPLVLTYHRKFKDFGTVLRRLLPTLYLDSEVKRVFTPPPFIAYKGARKLSSYLVRAKLYPLEREIGSRKCKRGRCQVCYNINETTTFTSSVSGQEFKINHRLDCSDKCLVYLLSCKVCKLQYVGVTTDAFRKRWNNYKSSNRKFCNGGVVPQANFHAHFLRSDHGGFLENVDITLIDKTDGRDPTQREQYWIDRLGTTSPTGLNARQEES